MAGTTDQNQQIDIKTIIAAGKKGKLIQYTNLLARVRAGETLTISELKTLDYLQAQFESDESTRPAAAPASGGRFFSTRSAILEYLTERGYKIKRSALGYHIRAGLLSPGTNGTFALENVDHYAAEHLTRLDGTPPSHSPVAALDSMAREKADAELRKAIAQATLFERRAAILEGAFISQAAHERDLAARAVTFMADFTNFVHAEAASIVAMVNGDATRLPDLTEFLLSHGSQWVARYATHEEFHADPSLLASMLADVSTVNDDQSEDLDLQEENSL